MAMSPEQSRTLDRLRTQLALTTQSVASLRYQLEINDPLPTWDTIQSAASALAFNMDLVMKLLEENAQFLKEAHVYPTTSFPGNTHEGMLGQLLRKKLEPGAEDWISEHTTQRQAEQQTNGVSKHDHALKDDELRQLWTWALGSNRSIVEPMSDEGAWLDNFTIAERAAGVENVMTGLKRDLEKDSEDDEDDDEDEEDTDENGMEDVELGEKAAPKEDEGGIDSSLPPMPLENVLKFMTTGALPSAGRGPR